MNRVPGFYEPGSGILGTGFLQFTHVFDLENAGK